MRSSINLYFPEFEVTPSPEDPEGVGNMKNLVMGLVTALNFAGTVPENAGIFVHQCSPEQQFELISWWNRVRANSPWSNTETGQAGSWYVQFRTEKEERE